MYYEDIIELMKKNLYIVFRDLFESNGRNSYVERLVAKHPLLKPEFDMEGNDVQGFKAPNRIHKSLESFPIYIELDGELDDDGNPFTIDHIDLYSEAQIKCQDRLSDTIFLAHHFEQTVIMDRIIRMNNTDQESFVIFSKIQDAIPLEHNEEENLLPVLEDYLIEFANSIRCINEVTVKGKSIAKCQKEGLC